MYWALLCSLVTIFIRVFRTLLFNNAWTMVFIPRLFLSVPNNPSADWHCNINFITLSFSSHTTLSSHHITLWMPTPWEAFGEYYGWESFLWAIHMLIFVMIVKRCHWYHRLSLSLWYLALPSRYSSIILLDELHTHIPLDIAVYLPSHIYLVLAQTWFQVHKGRNQNGKPLYHPMRAVAACDW